MTPNKINLKAKIERHSRILKDNLLKSTTFSNKYTLSYKIVLFVIIFIFPFYPALAALVYDNQNIDFYRWDIDESSIISSYQMTDDDLNKPIFESEDWNFLSVSTSSSTDSSDRNISISNDIINYEVKWWDSISSIASAYWVSQDSILWANDFNKNTVIHPWQKIKIPPVSWVIYLVRKWDTISSIAQKYDVSADKILTQNLLSSTDTIKVWQELIIPGWIKEVEVPVTTSKWVLASKTTTKTSSKTTSSKTSSSSSKYESEIEFSLVKRSAKRSFAWWNCTRFVAQYKNVTWWWNAKDWLYNARASWVETWYTPVVWSIIVFNWRWYNTAYWHVWIVTSVKSDYIIVTDMNYRAINEVTTRKVSKNDSAIKWYIYAD